MSRANSLRRMPAKELRPEQKADANRLKAAFASWQINMRAKNVPCTQEVAADALGFGQSALNQYLGGKIPLNMPALRKFSSLLGVSPASISPALILEARSQVVGLMELTGWNDEGRPDQVPHIGAEKDASSLRKNRSQKRRNGDTKRSAK